MVVLLKSGEVLNVHAAVDGKSDGSVFLCMNHDGETVLKLPKSDVLIYGPEETILQIVARLKEETEGSSKTRHRGPRREAMRSEGA
jgi:hypothetical protein